MELLLECFGDTLSANWWSGISTIVLTVTLVFIVVYTKSTNSLAHSTANMAEVQREEFGLRQRPIVTIQCHNPQEFAFRTRIRNRSNVHAKMKVRATIEVNGKRLTLPPNHHYNGQRIWEIQTMATESEVLLGHLGFENVFRHNGLSWPWQGHINQARVFLECWVTNFFDDDSELENDNAKNPLAHWDWTVHSGQMGAWVPEVCPDKSAVGY
jgi:hypothetical protein